MDLQQLRYFIAVAEELHFGRAARRLHMSQPPLSVQIKRLERELGVRLLDRTSQGARLTDAGVIFLEQARQLVGRSDDLVESMRRLGRATDGVLRLAYWSRLGSMIYPQLLRRFAGAYPNVAPILMEVPVQDQISRLLRHQVDVALLRGDLVDGIAGVESMVLFSDQLGAAVPAWHELARESHVMLDQIRDEPLIMAPREYDPGLYDLYMSLLSSSDDPLVPRHVSHSIVDLVAAGLGVACYWVSGRTVLSNDDVVVVPITPPVRLDVRLLWRVDDTAPALRNLLKVARDMGGQGELDPLVAHRTGPSFTRYGAG
jgi:DNA-binding transcriptional LysR family regulator